MIDLHDDSKVIVDLLNQTEGNEYKWYTPWNPNDPEDKSGLTIGMGFDVGQFNKDEIRTMFDHNHALRDKLLPLAGIKKGAAKALLSQTSHGSVGAVPYAGASSKLPNLSSNEVDEISKVAIQHQYDKIKRHITKIYPKLNFDTLSPQTKASIVGLYYSAPARIRQQEGGKGGYKDIHKALKKVEGGDMTGWNDFQLELASHDWGVKGSAMDNKTTKLADFLNRWTGQMGMLGTHEKIFGGVDNLFKDISDIDTSVDALPRYQLNLKPGSK